VDTGKANVARVYDYWLGGSHNFQQDRDAARALLAVAPQARAFARENRAFVGRAVRFMAGEGIRQFLDIGSGIPTQGNVHEIAHAAAPGARVVYADIDPVAVAHSEAILQGNPDTAVLRGDVREPGQILASARVRERIDFSQPVGVLLAAVLHFVTDEEDPGRITAALRDALCPGSYLLISHASSEGRPPALTQTYQSAYNRSVAAQGTLRSRSAIARLFGGFELAEPGLVPPQAWRPDTAAAAQEDLVLLAGVGRRS